MHQSINNSPRHPHQSVNNQTNISQKNPVDIDKTANAFGTSANDETSTASTINAPPNAVEIKTKQKDQEKNPKRISKQSLRKKVAEWFKDGVRPFNPNKKLHRVKALAKNFLPSFTVIVGVATALIATGFVTGGWIAAPVLGAVIFGVSGYSVAKQDTDLDMKEHDNKDKFDSSVKKMDDLLTADTEIEGWPLKKALEVLFSTDTTMKDYLNEYSEQQLKNIAENYGN